jgi:phosphatidylglycerophosphatase GEP4
MAPLNTNLQAFNLSVSTLLKNPSHFLPNLTISTFLDLPEQIGNHLLPSSPTSTTTTAAKTNLEREKNGARNPKISALVLDKDNTLCPPNTISIPAAYMRKLELLRTSPTSPFNQHTNPDGVLIVSNTAGSRPGSARYENEARELEKALLHLRIPVFRVQAPSPSPSPAGAGAGEGTGPRRKPFCGPDVLAWFRERGVVQSADEIAVVGDRLGTDTLMAAQMGAWSVWCKDGVRHSASGDGDVDYRGFLAKAETVLERYLRENRKVRPRVPPGWE